jgi:hypothetical protein
MKNLLFILLFLFCQGISAQTEKEIVQQIKISYLTNDGTSCNKVANALNKYPSNKWMIAFKTKYCTDVPITSMSLSLARQNISTKGGSDGSISLTINGGNAPYDVTWSNGQKSRYISGLFQGTYSVTVIDSKGQKSQSSITLTEKGDPPIPKPIPPIIVPQKEKKISINLKQASQNKYEWNKNLNDIEGIKITLKITAGSLTHKLDVTGKNTYTFSTGNAKWDGIPCNVELIVENVPDNYKIILNKIATDCACKP